MLERSICASSVLAARSTATKQVTTRIVLLCAVIVPPRADDCPTILKSRSKRLAYMPVRNKTGSSYIILPSTVNQKREHRPYYGTLEYTRRYSKVRKNGRSTNLGLI